MSKFSTTNSDLFTKQNKEIIPDWMNNLTDNLQIKERQTINLESEKRGVFAENQQVYRPEISADPRYLVNKYNETKMLSESKISLAKFLVGKYYKVSDEHVGTENVTLDVIIDGIGANFQFPFEVKAGRISTSNSFFANEGEYPFSKAGLNECLSDIKTGRIKQAEKVEGVGKVFVINREEIVRRYNGSLRQATDKINQLLSEGSIVGAGSNSYASFYDVDHLFPKLEKQAGEERMGEFHFAPNQERVASNQFKSARQLTVDASAYLTSEFGKDVSVKEAQRSGNELKVIATVFASSGIRKDLDIVFDIENEKLSSVKSASLDSNIVDSKDLKQNLHQVVNSLLNKYHSTGKTASKHAYSGMVLTSKEIESKLFKVVEASKIPSLINDWIDGGSLTPINSFTFATKNTFEELLHIANINPMSDEQTEEISDLQKHFGGGLEVETDLVKPQEEIREVEDKGSDEQRLFNANAFINRHLKKYRVASFNKISNDSYSMNVSLMNKATGTRHDVPFTISFDGSKVVECVASVGDHGVSIENLTQAFTKNKVLAKYLQDKSASTVAESIVISKKNLQRKLASVITTSKIDETINSWLEKGLMTELNQETLASDHSFEELLMNVNDESIITDEEQKVADYQSQHFGRQLKVNTDEKVEDTGVREAEETWSAERKLIEATREIGKLFNDVEIMNSGDYDHCYYAVALFTNPVDGSQTKLGFNFKKLENNKIGQIYALNDGKSENAIPISELKNVLEREASVASKYFASQVKVDSRAHSQNLISKTNLVNKLRVVASAEKVDSIVNDLTIKGLIQPINSATYASEYGVNKLVSFANDLLNIEDGQQQVQLANRDSHKISFSSKYEMSSDTRQLEASNGLSSKLLEVKNNLINSINKAESVKKITANKSNMLKLSLDEAKSVKDLEIVAKELRHYFQ
ncbi:hypothetical protein D3C87_76190 [compost metagenome]